jgi:histidinol-phosphate aminotransferase
VKIDLTPDYRHDLSKMLAATNGAGLVYVCNPNNPTASITPRKEIGEFLSRVPRQTIVLVDEAYHHYVESNDYESVIPLVKDNPNLIVARTFSKIYGMAGLRCGYCVARRENIGLMRAHQIFDSVNIMAIVAALAGLRDSDHVTKGRKLNSEVRKTVCGELDALGYRYIPSHANFMMIDLRREVRPVITAMRSRGVEVGRLFPALPTFMRVTIGTSAQMKAFLTAFRAAMA